jgi:citrate lyase beta subunit
MKIYHFINYRNDNLAGYVNRLSGCNATLCLDLEDSVQDIFNPCRTSELKKRERNFLEHKFFHFSSLFLPSINFGIRINPINSAENSPDIILVEKLSRRINLKSIFLAKVETKEDINNLKSRLDENKIKYGEIVAVIETKKGFANLTEIISEPVNKLKQIAFGHCDYNFDMNIFPFHHQNSEIYWDWIEKIITNKEMNGIGFLNSPYLELNNDCGFKIMLSKLKLICKKNFGQITLTYRQSKLCREFTNMNGKIDSSCFDEPSDLKKFASTIVEDFIKYHSTKGFSVTDNNRILISPHEYKAALKYLNK